MALDLKRTGALTLRLIGRLALLVALPLILGGIRPAQATEQRTVVVDGVTRTFFVDPGKDAAKTPSPLVFVFHQFGGGSSDAQGLGIAQAWPEATVVYPEGCKDPNEVLLRYGASALQEAVQRAKPIRPGHLVRPSDVPPRPREISYSTGMGFLDERIQLVRPELMVVTGQPGHGKGQFIRVMAFHLAEAHGWRTAFLTPEDPAHRLKRDMRRFAMRNMEYPSRDEQQQALDWIDQHFLISQPPEDEAITLETAEAEMEIAALHHGCQAFVLDPWNEVDHRIERNETIDMYIERSLRQLKRKSRRLAMVLIIAAHPTKLQRGEIPNLYSINGSANWKNKADHGVILFRDDTDGNKVKFILEKSKDWAEMGTPGEVDLEFNREKCDYFPQKNSGRVNGGD